MAGGEFLNTMMRNPVALLLVIFGGILFIGLAAGLAVLVSFVFLALIGLFLPVILFIFGMVYVWRGNTRVGLILIGVGIALWAIMQFRVVSV